MSIVSYPNKASSLENDLMFLCLVKIFCYLILIHLFNLVEVAFIQTISDTESFKAAKHVGILNKHSLTLG